MFVDLGNVKGSQRVKFLRASVNDLLRSVDHPPFVLELIGEHHPHYAPGQARVGYPLMPLLERKLKHLTVYEFSHELWHLFQDVFIIRYIRWRKPELALRQLEDIYEKVVDCWEVPKLVKTVLELPQQTFNVDDERRARMLISSVRFKTEAGRKLKRMYAVLESIDLFRQPKRPVRLLFQLLRTSELLFPTAADEPADLALLLDWAADLEKVDREVEQKAREALPAHFKIIRSRANTVARKLHPTQPHEQEAHHFAGLVLREYKNFIGAKFKRH
jgi:hypothetical protein